MSHLEAKGLEFEDAQPVKTLRDEIAIAAMASWITTYGEDMDFPTDNCPRLAKVFYAMADAMLKERNKC